MLFITNAYLTYNCKKSSEVLGVHRYINQLDTKTVVKVFTDGHYQKTHLHNILHGFRDHRCKSKCISYNNKDDKESQGLDDKLIKMERHEK